MKKIMCLFLALLTVLLLCACGKEGEPVPSTTQAAVCNHNWIAATCSAPKTCSICKETKGDALEHTWQDATCIVPFTCAVCKKNSGEYANHCYIGSACAVCGKANPEYKILTEGAWIRRMENGKFEIFIFGEGRDMQVLTNAEIGSTGRFLYTEEEFSALVQQYKRDDPANWSQAFADCMVCEIGGVKYVTGKVTKQPTDYLVEGEVVLVAYGETIDTYERADEVTLRFVDKEFYWVPGYKEVDTVASYFK